MPWTKETAKNGGKKSKRGASKSNAILRQTIAGALSEVDLKTALKDLKGFELIRAYSLLAKYAIPALASIELDITDMSVKDYMALSEKDRKDYIESIMN